MSYLGQEPRYGGSFVAVLGGYGVSRVLGGKIWVPVAHGALAQWVLGRRKPSAGEPLRWAAGLACGQVLWMAIGAIAVPELMINVVPDIVIDLVLIIWMVWRLSRAPLIAIIAWQAIALTVNVAVALNLPGWGADMAAILSHIILRTAIIGSSVYALLIGPLRLEVSPDEVEDAFT